MVLSSAAGVAGITASATLLAAVGFGYITVHTTRLRLDAEAQRQAASLAHERELADIADLRRLLDETALVINRMSSAQGAIDHCFMSSEEALKDRPTRPLRARWHRHGKRRIRRREVAEKRRALERAGMRPRIDVQRGRQAGAGAGRRVAQERRPQCAARARRTATPGVELPRTRALGIVARIRRHPPQPQAQASQSKRLGYVRGLQGQPVVRPAAKLRVQRHDGPRVFDSASIRHAGEAAADVAEHSRLTPNAVTTITCSRRRPIIWSIASGGTPRGSACSKIEVVCTCRRIKLHTPGT
jgi:hypothetical protein